MEDKFCNKSILGAHKSPPALLYAYVMDHLSSLEGRQGCWSDLVITQATTKYCCLKATRRVFAMDLMQQKYMHHHKI